MLLYTSSVVLFAQYKEYMICLIPFSKFPDVLSAFTCAGATGNPWSICLGINIFNNVAKSEERPFLFYWEYSIFESINNEFSTFIKSIYTFESIFFYLYILSSWSRFSTKFY